MTAISHLAPNDAPLAEYGYVLDANGNRVRLDATGSAVPNGVEEYAYDRLDRLMTATYATGSVTYAYDANGNRSSVTSGGATTAYVHDAADQLQELRDQNNALLVDLGYDGNGNRISSGSDTLAYDWANRLTQATVGGTSAGFAYLADGTRASKTAGTTTPYLYDRAEGLPAVVDDGATGYVHGAGGLLVEVGATATTWALADGLGSVRARADGSGAVVGAADWDAFGNVRGQTGAGGAFGWAGEQRDPETGLTYLRSRYYSSGVGRLLTPEVLTHSAPGTQGFNRYAYAGNNPVTYEDPSGHAAGLAGLGQAISGVFWFIAAMLDCYLQGECRYRRQHEPVEASAVLALLPYGTGALAREWDETHLRQARWRWPESPAPESGRGASPALKTLYQGKGGPRPQWPEGIDIPWDQNPYVAKWWDLQRLGQLIYFALWDAGYKGARVFLAGSRYTGVSYDDEYGVPAGYTRHDSDWDISIAEPTLFDVAVNSGIYIFGRGSVSARTKPLSAGLMERRLSVPNLPSIFQTLEYFDLNPRIRRPVFGPVHYMVWSDYRGYYDEFFGYEPYIQLPRPYEDFEPW